LVRRAVVRICGLIAATVMCGSAAARAVAVGYATEDFSVNVGLLLRAGHYYTFAEPNGEYLDRSTFSVAEAELATYGRIFERVSYDLRLRGFSSVREGWAAVDLPKGFSAKIGEQFVPFGVEATTPEGYLTCSSRTESSYSIAPGRNFGLRFDYLRTNDNWPYELGAAAAVFNNDYGYRYHPLVDGAWRVRGTPAPGVRTLEAGCSFYYGKEPRMIEFERLVHGPYYFPAPRLGFDVTYVAGPFDLAAEYMQYYIQKERIDFSPKLRGYVYKDDYYRGYFATLSYSVPLPYEYVNSIRPYVRYEHYKPAVLDRGDVEEDYYTGGFSIFFFDRAVMFRADYTRIIEEKNRIANDRIASEFQIMF
jgi:hypothetical protein